MEKYTNLHNYKYLLPLLLFLFLQSMIVHSTETLFAIFVLLPKNIVPFAFMLTYLLIVFMFYIHSIFDYIVFENEIKIRLGHRYKLFIGKRILWSFLFSSIVLILYAVCIGFDWDQIGSMLLLHLLQTSFFLLTSIILKKNTFQFILLTNLMLILLCRFIITAFMI